MSLLTAHKILIISAIALFAAYAVSELRHYLDGEAAAGLHSALSGVAAVALAIYLRWVWIHRPSDAPRR